MCVDEFRMIVRTTVAAAAALVATAGVLNAERSRIVLTENWHVKQLDNDQPDVAALIREAARLDPDRLFHPSSPFGGRVPNWPLEGDWHDYSTLKFSPQAPVPLYASEVGRVSAPALASMRRFMSPGDLWPEGFDPAITTPGKTAWPPMWQYRSVGGSWGKVGKLEQYCDPKSAGDLIRVLGTAHGDYLRDRAQRVTGAVFEDNFFDMPPGQKRTIAVVDAAGGRQITVGALNADPIRLEMD